MNKLKYLLSWALWPFLLSVCIAISAYGFYIDKSIIFFNVAYVFLIVSLFFIEQWMPHERKWSQPDGQNIVNIAHTLSSKGTVQTLLIFAGALGIADLITPYTQEGYSVWPRDWPLVIQIILGVVAAEFALYWAHRLSHEWPFLWRFHAIHHSAVKLWFLNTGRFHFIDSAISIILAMIVLVSLGAPMEVVKWQAMLTAFIGMLTHFSACSFHNVKKRGRLNTFAISKCQSG